MIAVTFHRRHKINTIKAIVGRSVKLFTDCISKEARVVPALTKGKVLLVIILNFIY